MEELIRELEASDDETTIELVAEALAEGPTSTDQLVRLLGHKRAAVRRAALGALGRRGHESALEAVEGRYEDQNGGVRAAACRAALALGGPRDLNRLQRLLLDGQTRVRAAAATAIAGAGAEAVDLLEGLLRQERVAAVREPALEALAVVGERHGGEVRLAALGALARAIGREADEVLVELATADLVRLAGDLAHLELLEPFRSVPVSGRPKLVEALAERPLGPGLGRIREELGALPPDAEALERHGLNLSQQLEAGRLGRSYGRERELRAILHRLSRPGPRGVAIVGPPGVGKTALVHEVTRRLAAEQVLVPTSVFEITTGEVLSGTRFLGEWQGRLKELLEALAAPRRAVWYLPDLNRLVDAGTTVHSDESFATMLAPALARGDLTILGTSTPEAYRRGLDRYPAFSRLFWRLDLEEPDPDATREVLEALTGDLREEARERRFDLSLPLETLERSLELADEYLAGQARPGRAVDLLREATASVLQEHEDADNPPHGPPRPVEVLPARVLATLSQMTGVPVQLLDDDVPLHLNEVQEFLSDRVLGQDEAVDAMVDLISLIKAGLTDPSRPLGVFFFVGPTGVGKTEMAKAVAEYIFGSAERLVRIDLGDFKEPDAHRRLAGDPQAIEPSARSGLLTAPVRERPFSVVLLDEVEKAHRNVFDLLLPVLGEGRLVDEQGRVTDFRRTIVIMTSNLGSDLRQGAGIGFPTGEGDDAWRKVLRVMEEVFRPEFLGRLDRTILFNSLTLEVMRRITRREVRRVLRRRGILRRNVLVEVDDSVIGILLKEGFSLRFGARPLKRRVEELLLRPLARALLSLGQDTAQAIVRLGVDGERIVFQVIRERQDDLDDESAESARPLTARIRDPRGRLVDVDDLGTRIDELDQRVGAIAEVLAGRDLRAKKQSLLEQSTADGFWDDHVRARTIMSEIQELERTVELPGRLERRLESLRKLHQRAGRQSGESRALHDLVARLDDVSREIELSDYAVHCTSPAEQGDAYLLLRRVGDAELAQDPLLALARMYLAYARQKRFLARVVVEAAGRGRLREVGLRISGTCACGVLQGENGLHQWVHRVGRNKKQVSFVRVDVFPPADEPLRPSTVTRERRQVRDEPGLLLEKPRLHLVLTHQDSLVAVDGKTDGAEDAEAEALAFLAARVQQRPGAPSAEAGNGSAIVRRYASGDRETARDFHTNLKLPLERVLGGELDDFVLPRVRGE